MAGEYFRFSYDVIIYSTIFLVSCYCAVSLFEYKDKKKRNVKREAAKMNKACQTSEICVYPTSIQTAGIVTPEQPRDLDDLDQPNLSSNQALFHLGAPHAAAQNNPTPSSISSAGINDYNPANPTHEMLIKMFQMRYLEQIMRTYTELLQKCEASVNQCNQSDSVSVNQIAESRIHDRSTNLVTSRENNQANATEAPIDRSLRARAKQRKTYKIKRTHD